MHCAVCSRSPAEVGVLCEECRDELAAPVGLLPDQVLDAAFHRAGVALIDVWGRPHRLDDHCTIGRHLETPGVAILDASISRRHAELRRAPDGQWQVRDLGSANGTTLDDVPVTEPMSIRHGMRLATGPIGFYFVEHADQLPEIEVDSDIITTMRPLDRTPAARVGHDLTEERAPAALGAPGAPGALIGDEEEHTDVGLPEVPMRVHEPTGGGGGLLEVGGVQVQLTTTQLELVRLLRARMLDEGHQPSQVRGFVRSSELIGALSWDTREPSDNHVKQLVHRVRRALIKAGVGDLLESRHRFGYRLRVIPREP